MKLKPELEFVDDKGRLGPALRKLTAADEIGHNSERDAQQPEDRTMKMPSATEQPAIDPIARLRASKLEYEASERKINATSHSAQQEHDFGECCSSALSRIDPVDKAKGFAHGMSWARDEGSYAEMVVLSEYDLTDGDLNLYAALSRAAGCDLDGPWEVCQYYFHHTEPNIAYTFGFIEGVQTYFEAVRDQLVFWPWGSEETAGLMASNVVMLARNPMSAVQFLAAYNDAVPEKIESVAMLDRVIRKLTAIRKGWKR